MIDPELYIKILKFLSTKGFYHYTDVTHFFDEYPVDAMRELYDDNPRRSMISEYLTFMANRNHIEFRPATGDKRSTNLEAVITHDGLKYYREDNLFFASKRNIIISYTLTVISIIVSIIAVSLNFGRGREIQGLMKKVEMLEKTVSKQLIEKKVK